MTPLDAPNSRFAVYLIPPYSVARDVIEIHRVLRKQFGFVAADKFQIHATIKGFFKKIPGPLEPLMANLDAVFATQSPIPIQFDGFRIDDVGIGLNVSNCDGKLNPELMDFRARVVEVVKPYIAPDCDFAEGDLGPPFRAHITLAFRDIEPSMQADVLNYLKGAPIPTEPFVANAFHFLEFFSDDWPDNWHNTLTWRLHKTWSLS